MSRRKTLVVTDSELKALWLAVEALWADPKAQESMAFSSGERAALTRVLAKIGVLRTVSGPQLLPATGEYVCQQCGRKGRRGFVLLENKAIEYRAVECASRSACRRRWPRTPGIAVEY